MQSDHKPGLFLQGVLIERILMGPGGARTLDDSSAQPFTDPKGDGRDLSKAEFNARGQQTPLSHCRDISPWDEEVGMAKPKDQGDGEIETIVIRPHR